MPLKRVELGKLKFSKPHTTHFYPLFKTWVLLIFRYLQKIKIPPLLGSAEAVRLADYVELELY